MKVRWFVVAAVMCAFAVSPAFAAGAMSRPSAAHALTDVTTVPMLTTTAHTSSVTAVPKFIFHAGLAFGAFHHFIYAPFKAGKFTSGGFFSKAKTYIEAGVAALFIYHETKLALADAQQNKALKLLVTPLTALIGVFDNVVNRVKHHKLDAHTVSSATTSVASIEALAKKAGSTVTEAVPSATQLATSSA